MERRLSAIMMIDVVGFSRLMEHAEEETILKLKGVRKQIMDPQIAAQGGTIVKSTGDGLLVEFSSAVAAVKAALQIQTDLADWEVDAAQDSRIVLRIGISVGDVVVDGDDLLGDAVNLAARMESLAKPGGICISASVHDHIRGDLGKGFSDGGTQQVKNITRPIQVFHWHATDTPQVAKPPVSHTRTKAQVFLGDFSVIGSEEQSRFLADACHHAVQAALSNFTGLDLTSDPARAEHHATASFQVLGNRYRVTVHLQDTVAAKTYGNAQFDGVMDDPFAAQDKLTSLIATNIRYGVHEREHDAIAGNAQTGSDYESMMTRVGAILMRSNAVEWDEADGLLDTLLAEAPNDFMALSMKAIVCLRDTIIGYRPISPKRGATADACSRRALEQNMNSDFAYVAATNVKLYVHSDLPGALRDIHRGLEISPGYPIAQMSCGLCLVADDHPHEALRLLEDAASAMKRTQIYHRILHGIALAQFVLKDQQACIDNCQTSLQLFPNLPQTMLYEIAATQELGRQGDAKSLADRLMVSFPDFRLSELAQFPYRNESVTQRYLGALSQAGLPA